jgi:hypothetical protein
VSLKYVCTLFGSPQLAYTIRILVLSEPAPNTLEKVWPISYLHKVVRMQIEWHAIIEEQDVSNSAVGVGDHNTTILCKENVCTFSHLPLQNDIQNVSVREDTCQSAMAQARAPEFVSQALKVFNSYPPPPPLSLYQPDE